ncbi:LOW QUALITY PROTEIN: filamin-a [Plakobranchus ocellatus]|uniref:Filamin-a n=1 Tax=Plakobranchus ocellatus TaxID=259542 RepID=A0AAV4BWN0_9GAST|nr:LOW QUALITY PROTEIN: filamin-a [Plakobranchus ocellatus]
MASTTSSYHQERHFASQFSGTSARNRAQNYSQAFAGSDFISAPGPTLPVGGTVMQEIDMAEEDDDQFAFNFPGPGPIPMSSSSPSIPQSDQASVRSASHYEENYVFKNQPTPNRRVRRKDVSDISSSKFWDDEHQSNASIISGSVASSVKGGRAGSGSDRSGWQLSASERRDEFAPQRSSTMLHRESRRETSQMSSRSSTTSTSTNRSKGKSQKAHGDRIIYERLPAFDEHISRQHHLRHVTGPGSVTSERSQVFHDEGSNISRYTRPAHVSSFRVNNSSRSRAVTSSKQFQEQVVSQSMHASRHFHQHNTRRKDVSDISSSKFWDDEHQSNASIISGSVASSVKGGRAGSGSDRSGWQLSASERRDEFAPQRSSTMLHRESRRETSQMSRSSTTSTSTNRSKGKSQTQKAHGDRIIYERLPAFDEHISRQHHLRHVTGPGSVTSERSQVVLDEGSNISRYTRPAHISSFRVNNSSRSRAVTSSKQFQEQVVSQSMHASRHFHQHNTRSQYGPGERGEYTIEVKFAEQEVSGSPFMAKAFDTRKLVVSDMPTTASREEPVLFHIDASQAGSGNIEIRVNEGRVQCSVENRGEHRFAASFLPENARPHKVEMTFNETPVEGSPWNIHIVDRSVIKITGEERVPCHKKATVRVQPQGQKLAENDLDAAIQGPTNQNVPYNLSSDSSGDTVITYIPTDVGDYTIRVKYGEHDVNGSPFTAKAYNTGAIIVTALEDGFVNQPMYFTIDVGEAGEGQLQIMVNNGNIPNEVEPQEPGKYRIKFIPTEAGMQQVDIHFNDHALPCSPLTCVAQDLSATIVGLTSLIPVQTESSFRIQSQAQLTNVASEVVVTGKLSLVAGRRPS